MKKIILSALLLAMTLTAGAIRPIHKLFPVKQSDGTTVMLYKNGDGHLAFYTTEDDKVVVRDANGRLCYGMLDANGSLVASAMTVHNLNERTAAELAFVSNITLKPSDSALRPLLADIYHSEPASNNVVKRAGRASTSDGLGKFGTPSGGQVPSIGNLTVPVIMVAYSDMDFQAAHDSAKISRYFNEPGYHEDNSQEVGSVKDYFVSQSYGHFNPTFDVVAKVTLNHPYAYYGANRGTRSGDARAMDLVRDAIAAAVAQGVDFSKYRVNGTIPNVTIMYAGQGEATGGDENTIWPHERDLNWYTGNISGNTFDSYFVGNEMYGNDIMGIGVFCHEFSHALGLPDFYVTDYSYSNDHAFGYWSIMDYGPYLGGSYAPVGYNAYERSYMGWLDIKDISNADAQSITLANQNDSDAAYAVMFRNPSDRTQYFILENRQAGTWYPASLGTGLMVTRIAYYSSDWQANIVNNNQRRKDAMLVTADGSTIGAVSSEESYGNRSQLFGNGVNYCDSLELHNFTQLKSYPFYKIVKQSDGTITLSFKDASLNPTNVVYANDGRVFAKVTDLSQLSRGDSVIFVNEAEGVALNQSVQGFNRGAVNVRMNGNYAYGNSDVQVFSVMRTTNGASWGFRCPSGYLSVTNNGISMNSRTNNALVSITINNGVASLYFTGNIKRYLGYASPETYFTSYTEDPANLAIYRLTDGVVDGINAVTNVSEEKAADNRVFNLNGQYVGTSLTGLQKGVYIQNGKKVVVK